MAYNSIIRKQVYQSWQNLIKICRQTKHRMSMGNADKAQRLRILKHSCMID